MGNATNETTKKTNWLDAIKAQFKRIIWPTKEEVARSGYRRSGFPAFPDTSYNSGGQSSSIISRNAF